MLKENVFIYKLESEKYQYNKELFVLDSSGHVYQSYSGTYDIPTILWIIQVYSPCRILVNCAHFHARDIVKMIYKITNLNKYKMSISRVSFRNDIYLNRIVMINFRRI